VPTNTSANVANYAVMNAVAPYGSSITLSQANLKITCAGAYWAALPATFGVSSGKWYWEAHITNFVGNAMIGITKETDTGATTGQDVYPGISASSYGYLGDGQKYNNATGAAYGASYTTNDIIGVALDMDAGTLTFYKNNASQGTAFSSLSGTYLPSIGVNDTSSAVTANFGQRPFSYTPPAGFVALNTYNIPTPTILQGNLYMDASLYTGDAASTKVIVNQGQFKPDFVWGQSRSDAYGSWLFDSNRGTTKQIESFGTNAQSNQATMLTAFNNNGFSMGNDTAGNNLGSTFVGWQWQAGQGTTTVNTSGATSSNVSVSTTAGFSIVTYTGTGANTTIGHGLSSAPSMIMVKNRGSASAWAVWHTSIANTQYLVLNTDAAVTTGATRWNSTTPTSSVISVGTSTSTNASGNTYVAYCWSEIAGFSKFGSYTGNGSADGPFNYLGFRPKFIILKRTDSTGNWSMYDSTRNPYNAGSYPLFPNLTDAESASTDILDWLSNGFKLRSTNLNTNAGTFVYMAYAENPFKNSNAK